MLYNYIEDTHYTRLDSISIKIQFSGSGKRGEHLQETASINIISSDARNSQQHQVKYDKMLHECDLFSLKDYSCIVALCICTLQRLRIKSILYG